MTKKTQDYLENLERMYQGWNDQESLLALADVRESDQRARELEGYREHPQTQLLIRKALDRMKVALNKLTNKDLALTMSAEEKAYAFATLDWANFTLDIVGETPQSIDAMIDRQVSEYASKAGLT